jgi:hypothetical protein
MTETAAPVMQTVVVDGTTKYTISYPLTGEDGQPLFDRNQKPRFTNIVADSPEELITKQALQNQEVSRALDRSSRRFETLSGRKPTTRVAAAELKSTPLTQEEEVQVGLDAQDPRKTAGAIRRVVESVVPVEEITSEVKRQAQTIDVEARKNVARAFIASAKDYLPIEANNALLNKYLLANNLEFTVENLEFAAAAMGPSLVAPRRERTETQTLPENDLPPSTENAPPENAPPNRDTPPAQTRRVPVSGISNSQVSGRQTSETVLTNAQAREMLFKDRAKYEAWMRDPVKNKILNAALASR